MLTVARKNYKTCQINRFQKVKLTQRLVKIKNVQFSILQRVWNNITYLNVYYICLYK